jgi:hypothetical protein
MKYNGISYFVDFRLSELRDVNNPHNAIKFDDLPDDIQLQIYERRHNMTKRTTEEIKEELKRVEEKLTEAERIHNEKLKAQESSKLTTGLSVAGFILVCFVVLVMFGPIGLAIGLLVSVIIYFVSQVGNGKSKYPLNTISKYLIHALTVVIIVVAVGAFAYGMGPFGLLVLGFIGGTIYLVYKHNKKK